MDDNQVMLSRANRYAAGLTDEARQYLSDRGIDEAATVKYSLGICDDIYHGRLSIPYLRRAGVVGFNFRSIHGDTPKYLTQGHKHLYNTAALDRADLTGSIYITEGEFDAIIATERYGLAAVGVPGAAVWKALPYAAELFRGYDRIVVLADPDDAGMALAATILADIPRAEVRKLQYDVTDCYLKGIKIDG